MSVTVSVTVCPANRTVNEKSICLASVNNVSYRVGSRGFSSLIDNGWRGGPCVGAKHIATQIFLDSRHNPTALA